MQQTYGQREVEVEISNLRNGTVEIFNLRNGTVEITNLKNATAEISKSFRKLPSVGQLHSWKLIAVCRLTSRCPIERVQCTCIIITSRSARYSVSANYHEPRLPATKSIIPNTNYMNNIFKPLIDQLDLDVSLVVVPTQHRTLVYLYS